MEAFLKSTPVIDWAKTEVLARARMLRAGHIEHREIARRCFEWVRDEIRHSRDHRLDAVPCSASETLREGSGYCYAKSHLLAALLRANGIPAGFCYQRLSRDGEGAPYCLHALNAVRLPGVGWHRVDARGNHGGIHAAFTPPYEKLAFAPALRGERDFPEIWPDPLPVVVESLRSAKSARVLHDRLPDVPVIDGEPHFAYVSPPEYGRLPRDSGDGGD